MTGNAIGSRPNGPACDACAKEHGPLWQLGISNWHDESCLFCGLPTRSLYDLDQKIPDWLLHQIREDRRERAGATT